MLVKAGIEWQSSTWLPRNADSVLPEIATAAFKAAKPKDGKSTWVEHKLSTGDTVLIRVSAVRVDDLKSKQVMKDLAQAADQVFADAMTDAFASSVKAEAKTEVLLK
jgi:peptidyl-prolyl cis-trans isomerase D